MPNHPTFDRCPACGSDIDAPHVTSAEDQNLEVRAPCYSCGSITSWFLSITPDTGIAIATEHGDVVMCRDVAPLPTYKARIAQHREPEVIYVTPERLAELFPEMSSADRLLAHINDLNAVAPAK